MGFNSGFKGLITSPDLQDRGCSPMHPTEGLQSGLDVLMKRESGIKIPAVMVWKIKESAVFKITPVGTKSHSSRSWHIVFQDSYPDSSKASRKRQGRWYHNSDYVYILNELLICDSQYTNVDVHESVHRYTILKSNQQYTTIHINLLPLVSSTAVSTHPWHQPAATWVNTTRYCNYSQVLLMMGENISRNM